MSPRLRFGLAIFASACAAIPLLSQTPDGKKPSFEVSSVKVSKPGPIVTAIGTQGCRFVATNATLRSLLQFAYRPSNGQLPVDQIMGGPDWMVTGRFDVQAKPEGDPHPVSQAEMQLMVQSFLEDRFQLKAHLDTRELPIYTLVSGKDRLKLKVSADQTPTVPAAASCAPSSPSAPAGTRGAIRQTLNVGPTGRTVTLSGSAITLSNLIVALEQYVGRPIVDKTGLAGLFDINLLRFPPARGGSLSAAVPAPASADPSGPTMLAVIQEQLGLKLELGKGPVEVLVIDSVQKPSEN